MKCWIKKNFLIDRERILCYKYIDLLRVSPRGRLLMGGTYNKKQGGGLA